MPHLLPPSWCHILGRACFLFRKAAVAIGNKFQRQNLAFGVTAVSLIGAKAVHVYAHFGALQRDDVLLWGTSLFFQDVLVLASQPLLLATQPSGASRNRNRRARIAPFALAAILLLLATMSISFFIVSGSELQWHNVAVAVDSSWWAMLPSGLTSFGLVLTCLVLAAAGLQDIFYAWVCAYVDLLRWAVNSTFRTMATLHVGSNFRWKYGKLPKLGTGPKLQNNLDDGDILPLKRDPQSFFSRPFKLRHVFVAIGLVVQLFSVVFRPSSSTLTAMSWTLPLLPIVDIIQSSRGARSHFISRGGKEAQVWANKTALSQSVHLSWLPQTTKLPGFEDWYETGTDHYLATEDPLKISNLDSEPIAALRSKLADISIRHVVLVILESYRKDVFPIKRDGFIWTRLANSFPNKTLPALAEGKLSSLTPKANFLTGDYADGFEHGSPIPRGGINANNAHTSSTYTLKSLTATLCGVTPLVVDFNAEHHHHVYQPCLPQVFQALNEIDCAAEEDTANKFQQYKWRSSHMQSATTGMDDQDSLMSVFGYDQENIINKEYLQSDAAQFGKVLLPAVNYFSLPEVALEDYIREAFSSAMEKNERVFLSHLTSTTHHDFGIPESEQYVPLAANAQLGELSRYLNAVGYGDRWLGRMLEILEECGVANETLVVIVGDHGLPLPEGSVSTYGNAKLASSHVPLVFSHPHLPHVDVDEMVTSSQILPTILDLLIESGSLLEPAVTAMRSLVQNYEGQSLLRPLRTLSPETGQGAWQYTVVNPGGSMLSVRDASQPHWHLVVPLVDSTEWRFANLRSDPHELDQILAFDFETLIRRVQNECGSEAANWIEEAVAVSGWWVEENKRRWRHGNGAA